jgi:hypothetical protein
MRRRTRIDAGVIPFTVVLPLLRPRAVLLLLQRRVPHAREAETRAHVLASPHRRRQSRNVPSPAETQDAALGAFGDGCAGARIFTLPHEISGAVATVPAAGAGGHCHAGAATLGAEAQARRLRLARGRSRTSRRLPRIQSRSGDHRRMHEPAPGTNPEPGTSPHVLQDALGVNDPPECAPATRAVDDARASRSSRPRASWPGHCESLLALAS